MISWFPLVPARVPGLVSLLFFSREGDCVPSFFLVPSGSGSGSKVCFPIIFFSFLRKGILFHHDFLLFAGSG